MDSRLIFLRWRRTAQVNPVVLRVRILGPDPFGVTVLELALDPMLVRLAY